MSKVYQYVTDRIIAKLEEGTIPWIKPWNDAKYEAAYNAESGRCYKGINALLLDEGGYMTWNQIKKAGWKVRKGGHSHMVTFWKFSKVVDEDGEETGRKIPFLRYYKVYHESDIEGYVKKVRPNKNKPLNFTPNEHAHDVASRYMIGDNIIYREGGNRAFYRHGEHSITMPRKKHFKTIEGYYSTLFHEAGHSTLKGLERVGLSYGKEEGVAELCSAYLMRHFGLSNEGLLDNTADYIANWISELKKDPKLIISTASKADKAMQYILDVAENTEYSDICPLDIEETTEPVAASPVVLAVKPVQKGMKRTKFYIYSMLNGKKKAVIIKGYFASELHKIEGIGVDRRANGQYYFTDLKSGLMIKSYFGCSTFKYAIKSFNEEEHNGKDIYTVIREMRQTDVYKKYVAEFQKHVADAEKKRTA